MTRSSPTCRRGRWRSGARCRRCWRIWCWRRRSRRCWTRRRRGSCWWSCSRFAGAWTRWAQRQRHRPLRPGHRGGAGKRRRGVGSPAAGAGTPGRLRRGPGRVLPGPAGGAAVITAAKKGSRTRGLVEYRFGPGRSEEHTNQRIVAAWSGAWEGLERPDEVQRALLAAELDAPLETLRGLAGEQAPTRHVYHVSISNHSENRTLTDDEWAVVARAHRGRAAGVHRDRHPGGGAVDRRAPWGGLRGPRPHPPAGHPGAGGRAPGATVQRLPGAARGRG